MKKGFYLISSLLLLASCATPVNESNNIQSEPISSDLSYAESSENSSEDLELSSSELVDVSSLEESIEQSSEDSSEELSPYELFKKEHPNYYGNETDYNRDLKNGMLEEEYDYEVVSLDNELGAIAGSVNVSNGYMNFNNAIVELDEELIFPLEEESEWNLSIKGIMNTTGEYLVNKYENTDQNGRVYFGINQTNGLFIGVNIDNLFHNYCFDVPSNYLTTNHQYDFSLEEGIFYLSIDNGQKQGFATFNIGQANALPVSDCYKASQELINKIRALNSEYFFSISYLGAMDFTCKMKLESMNLNTNYIYNYKGYQRHLLKDKMIFQLGSSISFGASNGGRSFVEQIAGLTGSKYQKETVSGTTLAKRASYNNSYMERFSKFDFSKNPDYLIIQLSTNDFVNNVGFGEVDSTPIEDSDPADFDVYTICGAIEYIIAKTKEMDEDTKIYFYSCPIKPGWGSRNKYQLFLNNQLKAIIKKWDIGLIDLYNLDNLTRTYHMADDIHPNANGYSDVFTPNMINQLLNDL